MGITSTICCDKSHITIHTRVCVFAKLNVMWLIRGKKSLYTCYTARL